MDRGGRRIVTLVVVVAVVWFALAKGFGALKPREDLAEFGSLLGALVFASAILERALDVLLSLAFGGEADRLDARSLGLQTEMDAAQKAGNGAEVARLQADLNTVRGERHANRALTMKWALPASIAIGTLMSAVGLRALHALVEQASVDSLNDLQKATLKAVDIVLTGMLLGGGSEGIHRVVALFRSWTDAKRDQVT